MRKFLVVVIIASFMLVSCGTLEIGFDFTPTPIFTSSDSQLTQTDTPSALQPATVTPVTPPTQIVMPFVTQPGAALCSASWFFAFDNKHQSLGTFCPAPAKMLAAVGQDFEGGRVYRYDPDPDYPQDPRGTIYVIFNDGEWITFPDTWDASQPSSDPSLVPPEGLYQPIEGIGKVWRDFPEVQKELGWAYETQSAFQGRFQRYSEQAGQPSGDSHYSFIDHGKWNIVLLLNSVDMGPNIWEVAGTYP